MVPVFELLPAAVPVLLTRKRQRLGDLLAGTIVLEQRDAPVWPPASDDRNAAEGQDGPPDPPVGAGRDE
jgi:hypothetical protein